MHLFQKLINLAVRTCDFDYKIADFKLDELIKIQKVICRYYLIEADISNDIRLPARKE